MACRLRKQRDVIVKLHTGQGKTLIGLLMLQSSLNEGLGPAMYLCPNNFLVKQTIDEATSFGIKTIPFDPVSTKLPSEFLNSESILVANCNKLFNGKSVFGVFGSLRTQIRLGAIVVDDAHKCLEIIRQSFSVVAVSKRGSNITTSSIYKGLWSLFEEALTRQASGTCSDISHGANYAMAVPFWSWHEKQKEVLSILQQHKDDDELLFTWDLIKNGLARCVCVFSGDKLEIFPRLLPLELIPSFAEAGRRIFLSATLTEDAFLVRDLGIEPSSVSAPLSSGDVTYSGERLILMPMLVDTSLNRSKIITWVSQLAEKHGNFGVVSIVPSFPHSTDWANQGADVRNVRNLESGLSELKYKIKEKRVSRYSRL